MFPIADNLFAYFIIAIWTDFGPWEDVLCSDERPLRCKPAVT